MYTAKLSGSSVVYKIVETLRGWFLILDWVKVYELFRAEPDKVDFSAESLRVYCSVRAEHNRPYSPAVICLLL